MKKYRITINKRGYIPGIGNGPITRPIMVTQKIYDQLVKLGYPIKVVQDLTVVPVARPAFVNANPEEVVNEQPSEEVSSTNESITPEEVVNEQPSEEVVQDIKATEEIIDNEEIVDSESEIIDSEEDDEIVDDEEEIIVDDKDLSANAFYTQEFLSSKNMCKKILDARQVSYDNSASFTVLKQLVSESNPDVEIVEE